VIEYYSEARQNFGSFSLVEAAVLVLACNVRFQWPKQIGENLAYERLLDESIIFPYDPENQVCVLPPVLLPKDMKEIDNKIQELVPGVRRQDVQLTFHDYVYQEGNYKAGADNWENYIICSLAVLGFLRIYTSKENSFFMKDVYTVIPGGFVAGCFDKIGRVNFCGVKRLEGEVCCTDSHDTRFIYINEKKQNAHHDGVIFSMDGGFNAAIQAKFTLEPPEAVTVNHQLAKATVLLWFYLDAPEIEKQMPKNYQDHQIRTASEERCLAFLNGNGCISPLLIDNLFFLKKFNQLVERMRTFTKRKRAE